MAPSVRRSRRAADSRKAEEAASKAKAAEAADAAADAEGEEAVPADQVLRAEYLSAVMKKKQALAGRLQRVFKELRELNQAEVKGEGKRSRPVLSRGLKQLMQVLVDPSMIGHKDREVRLLVACSHVEVLRICAPNAPYTPEQQRGVFQLVVTLLQSGLPNLDQSTGETGNAARLSDRCIRHILQSLAEVQSSRLLAQLCQQGEEGAEEQMKDLFDTLLSCVRSEHPTSVLEHVVGILVSCVEELEHVPQSVLDALLTPLLPVSFRNNEASYRVALKVCSQCASVLQAQISGFCNGVLSAGSGSEESELSEHIMPLIYELHKAMPELLYFVLPSLTQQLRDEEDDARKVVVQLLGRLYASRNVEYGEKCPKPFHDFLGRCRDKNAEIRMQMAEIVATLAQRKAALRGAANERLAGLLSDPDADVRQYAVEQCAAMATEDIAAATEPLLRALGERVKDKKVAVRRDAIVALAKIFGQHVSSKWAAAAEDGSDGGEGSDSDGSEEDGSSEESAWRSAKAVFEAPIAGELTRKVGWMAEHVLLCFAYPDAATRELVLGVFDSLILWRSAAPAARAAGFAALWARFGAAGREAVSQVLRAQRTCQQALASYLDARDACADSAPRPAGRRSASDHLRGRPSLRPSLTGAGASSLGSDGLPGGEEEAVGLEMALQQRLLALGECVAPEESGVMQELNACRDGKVFKALRVLASPREPADLVRSCRDGAVRAVGSKSKLGRYLRRLGQWVSTQSWMAESTAAAALRLARDAAAGAAAGRHRAKLVELLEAVARAHPPVLGAATRDLAALAQLCEDGDLRERVLRCATRLVSAGATPAETAETDAEDVAEELEASLAEQLRDGAHDGVAKQTAKLAAALRGLLCDAAHAADDGDGGDLDEEDAAAIEGEDVLRGADCDLALATPEQLLARLRALSVSALYQPLAFAARRGAVMDFVWASVLNGKDAPRVAKAAPEDEEGDEEDEDAMDVAEGGGARSKEAVAVWARIQCAALKLATNDAIGHACVAGEEAAGEELRRVVDALFDVLAEDGGCFTPWGTNAAQRSAARSVASSALLKLLRRRELDRMLSPSQWHALGWTALDGSLSVRERFYLRARKAVNCSVTPLRFLAYLSLAQVEKDDALRHRARRMLRTGIAFLRENYERRVNEIMGAEGGEDGAAAARDECSGLATCMMPENVVPYCIHLLAHHPTFQGDAKRLGDHGRCLKLVLDALVGSLGSEADNFSFLLDLLQTLIRDFEDAVAPDSRNAKILATVAFQLLRKGIRRQENLAPYLSEIRLPMALFTRITEEQREERRRKEAERRRSSAAAGYVPSAPAAADDFSGISPIAAPASPAAPEASQQEEREERRKRRASLRESLDSTASDEEGDAADASPPKRSRRSRGAEDAEADAEEAGDVSIEDGAEGGRPRRSRRQTAANKENRAAAAQAGKAARKTRAQQAEEDEGSSEDEELAAIQKPSWQVLGAREQRA